jgi:hypothetical protein
MCVRSIQPKRIGREKAAVIDISQREITITAYLKVLEEGFGEELLTRSSSPFLHRRYRTHPIESRFVVEDAFSNPPSEKLRNGRDRYFAARNCDHGIFESS